MANYFDNSDFTMLGEFEEAPEIEYEPIPVPGGPWPYVVLAECFMKGFADGVESMCPCRPAPIEVEAEVISTEINRPTKGLLHGNDR